MQLASMDESFPREWATTFFKCTRWMVKETMDLTDCPFQYFCDSTYAGDYPPFVDLLVLLFTVSSYLLAAIFTLLRFTGSNSESISIKRRYLVPSGPIALPIMLLVLAKGQRINTLFPLSLLGPVLLHLVHVSALAFENRADRSVKYAVLEASTISGILHASLYLDSIILPYYTGLEALTKSTFSGECATCVCLRDALVVGGRLVTYRGWSRTMLAVVGTLGTRILSRNFREEKVSLLIKVILEGISWMLIVIDSVYLMIVVPKENVVLSIAAAYGGLLVLIFLNVLERVGSLLAWVVADRRIQKRIDLCNNIGEIP